MTTRTQRLTEVVRTYDPRLFVQPGTDGKSYLIRKNWRYETYEFNGGVLRCVRDDPQTVFALTEDWSPKGKAVDWGIEPLIARIREIDGHRSNEINERIEAAYHLREEAKAKDFGNKTEAFAYELRTAVKNDFKDINTSICDRRDPRYARDKKMKERN